MPKASDLSGAEVAIIYRADGEVGMVVVPDQATSLDDPAFNPRDGVHLRIPRETFDEYQPDADRPPSQTTLQRITVDALEAVNPELARLTRAMIVEADAIDAGDAIDEGTAETLREVESIRVSSGWRSEAEAAERLDRLADAVAGVAVDKAAKR